MSLFRNTPRRGAGGIRVEIMSPQLDQLAAALCRAQGKIRGAKKDVKGQVGAAAKMYADLGSVWEATREALQEEKLAVAQVGAYGPDGATLRTILTHESGQWIAGEIPLVYESNPKLTKMQCLGSALTYARRYGLAAILGVCTEDDDAETSGNRGGSASRPRTQEAPQRPRQAAPPQRQREDDPARAEAPGENAPGLDLHNWLERQRAAVGKNITAWAVKWAVESGMSRDLSTWSKSEADAVHAAAVAKLKDLMQQRSEAPAAVQPPATGPVGGSSSPEAARRQSKDWDRFVDNAMYLWHDFDPIADGKARTAREHQFAHGMLTLAIQDGEILESAVTDPATKKRIPAKCFNALKGHLIAAPEYMHNAMKFYLSEKEAELRPHIAPGGVTDKVLEEAMSN